MPEHGQRAWNVAVDINMMSNLAAEDRTEEQWRALLLAAGFEEPRFFWTDNVEAEVAIEVTRA